MTKAIIKFYAGSSTSGEVVNLVACGPDGGVSLKLPDGYTLYDSTNFALSVGDKFESGVFYTAADPTVPVAYVPTADEKIAAANNSITHLEDAVTGLMDMMVLANGGM